MLQPRRLLALLPLAALAACATSSDRLGPAGDHPQAVPAPLLPRRTTRPTACFWLDRRRSTAGAAETAAAYFGRAAAGSISADAPLLDTRAFTASLLAGDVEATAAAICAHRRLLRRAGPAPPGRSGERLSRGAGRQGDAKGAHAILTGPNVGAPYRAADRAARAVGRGGGPATTRAPSFTPSSPASRSCSSSPALTRASSTYIFAAMRKPRPAFRSLITAGGDPGGLASLTSEREMLERRANARRRPSVAVYRSGPRPLPRRRGVDQGAPGTGEACT